MTQRPIFVAPRRPDAGGRPRNVANFFYVEEPDMVGNLERTQQLYERTLPMHRERAGKRAEEYIDWGRLHACTRARATRNLGRCV